MCCLPFTGNFALESISYRIKITVFPSLLVIRQVKQSPALLGITSWASILNLRPLFIVRTLDCCTQLYVPILWVHKEWLRVEDPHGSYISGSIVKSFDEVLQLNVQFLSRICLYPNFPIAPWNLEANHWNAVLNLSVWIRSSEKLRVFTTMESLFWMHDYKKYLQWITGGLDFR